LDLVLYTDQDCINEVKVVQESAGDDQNDSGLFEKTKTEESGVGSNHSGIW